MVSECGPEDADYVRAVSLFNTEEFAVWVNGPNQHGEYMALTLDARSHEKKPGPTGRGPTPSNAVWEAWHQFEADRTAYDC